MSQSRTIIGPTAMVCGHVEGQENLQVAGRIEGTIAISETLTIDPGGVVLADITVRSAVIHGVLVGNIEAAESVAIGSEGRVVGDIRAPEVVLNQGAGFTGHIDMGEIDLDEQPQPPPVKVSKVPAPIHSAPPPPAEPQSRGTASFTLREPRYSTPPTDSMGPPPKNLTSWASQAPVSRTPAPRRTAPVSVPDPAPKRPAAPTPKVRNIGRAKARRHPS